MTTQSEPKQASIVDFIGYDPTGDPNAPPYREGVPATHDLGVAYHGPWVREGDGFQEHVRRCARALSLTGCPVHLRHPGKAITLGAPKSLPASIEDLLTTSVSQYSAQVHQAILNASYLHNLLRHKYMSAKDLEHINSRRIIYSVWERDRISQDAVRALNCVGQVWTACTMNAEMLERCGVSKSKIRVVPVPYFDSDPLLNLNGRQRRPGVPRFYHIGKWEPRKAQDKILEAFLLAFAPGEAHLVMKVNPLSKPVVGFHIGPVEALQELLRKPEVRSRGWSFDNCSNSLEFVIGQISAEKIAALHSFGDIYVSLSRGEGFDMPAFDAKLAGNQMVYTPSGGPLDFAGETDVVVPSTGMIPCHPMYGWEPDAMYLDFDVRRAASAMRYAVNAKADVVDDMSRFRAEAVGKQMLRNLEEVTQGKVF